MTDKELEKRFRRAYGLPAAERMKHLRDTMLRAHEDSSYLADPEMLKIPGYLRFLQHTNSDSYVTRGMAPQLLDESNTAAEKVADLMRKHMENPEYPSITELPRSSVPVSELSERDLRDAGFVPSYVAVPEIGQTQVRTWRHPYSGMHIHRHGDRWLYHVDNYPSIAMQIRALRLMQKSGIPMDDLDPGQLADVMTPGVKHVLQEGLPGYVSYTNGITLGDKGIGYNDTRTFEERLPRALAGIATATGGVSLLSRLLSKDKKLHIGSSAAGVGAFLGTKALMDRLFTKGVQNGSISEMPSWAGMTMLGVAPILAGVGAYSAGRSLDSLLNGDKKKRKGKKSQEEDDEA